MIRAGVLMVMVGLLTVVPALPASAVELTTPYPGITVEPGQDVSLSLGVTSPQQELVQLDVSEAPEGWTAFLLGGEHRVSSVFASGNSPEVQLQVQVPEDAAPGGHSVVVNADGPSGADSLTVTFEVVEQAPGAFDLSAEFPELRGGTGDTYRFDATIQNNSAQPAQFGLAAEGPEGWDVQARPSTEEQAATVTVEPNAEATVQVEVTPPEEVTADTYPVVLRATGEGTTLEQQLSVEITGTPALELQTRSERLDVSGNAGDSTSVQLVVRNTGSAPLEGVSLSASPPSGWETAFEPGTVNIPPGEETNVTARIRPSGEAIAGDYSVTVDASAEGTEASVDLRYAVETSAWWGVLAVLIIVAAVGGLLWTFQRFGRR